MAAIAAITLLAALLLSVPIAVAIGLAAMASLFYLSPDSLVLLPQKILSGMDAFDVLRTVKGLMESEIVRIRE